MKRNLVWILSVILFITVFAYFAHPLFMPPKQGNVKTEPFWIVESSPDRLSVFTLTLNESKLEELVFVLGNRLSLSIFIDKEGKQLEGYIRETHVGGITARIPFTLRTTPAQLEEIMPLLTPSKKSTTKRTIFEIPEEYHPRFYDNIVDTIAFIPMAVSLDDAVIRGRFGDNPTILKEETNGVIHYLYPEKGIDISLDATGEFRSIVQYVTPNEFEERIMTPLLLSQEAEETAQ